MKERENLPREMEAYRDLVFSPEKVEGFTESVLRKARIRQTRRTMRQTGLLAALSLVMTLLLLQGGYRGLDDGVGVFTDGGESVWIEPGVSTIEADFLRYGIEPEFAADLALDSLEIRIFQLLEGESVDDIALLLAQLEEEQVEEVFSRMMGEEII